MFSAQVEKVGQIQQRKEGQLQAQQQYDGQSP